MGITREYSIVYFLISALLVRTPPILLLLFASKSDTLISRYILGNACVATICISGYCHIKNMTYI